MKRKITDRFFRRTAALMAMLMMLVSFTALMSGCRSGSNGEVYVYSYGDYFDPEIIEDFEAETGIKVIPDYFDTAEEMYTVLENGATSYDCVCTSGRCIPSSRTVLLHTTAYAPLTT